MPVDELAAEREATAEVADLSEIGFPVNWEELDLDMLALPTDPTKRNLLLGAVREMTERQRIRRIELILGNDIQGPTPLPDLSADRERTERLMRLAKRLTPASRSPLDAAGAKEPTSN